MEKISFDNGIREFSVNGAGTLRFNPSDPNVYQRFTEAAQKVRRLEESLSEKQAENKTPTQLLAEADKELKDLLCWVFGPGNDFDEILGGVNLLAVAENGRQVITNLLEALSPILSRGAERCVHRQVEDARRQARARRENQV